MDPNNFFDDYFLSDLLLQGMILSTFIVIGFTIVFRDFKILLKSLGLKKELNEIKRATKSLFLGVGNMLNIFVLKKKPGASVSRSISQIYNLIPIVCLAYVILVVCGIIGNRLGDTWMDQQNVYHLGLKHLWFDVGIVDDLVAQSDKIHADPELAKKCHHPHSRQTITREINYLRTNTQVNESVEFVPFESSYAKQKLDNLGDTDTAIKLLTFDEVFPEQRNECIYEKAASYYDAKNKALIDDKWRDYLVVTQRLVNYSQVLVFSILIFLVVLYIDLWIVLIISFKKIIKNLIPGERNFQNTLSWINALMFPLAFGYFIYMISFNQNTSTIAYGHFAILIFYLLLFFFLFLASLWLRSRQITTMVNYRVLTIFCCIILYAAVGVAWRENEKEFDYKIYEVHKITKEGIVGKSPTKQINSTKALPNENNHTK
jgi:hypothetical protein